MCTSQTVKSKKIFESGKQKNFQRFSKFLPPPLTPPPTTIQAKLTQTELES